MKGKKLMRILRIINIATGALVVVLSVLSFIFVVIGALTSLKFFLIFSPVFMTAFGIAMLGAQFKVKFILKRLPFLKTPVGRGLFNVYLSSVIYYYFDASNNEILAWVGALSLFFSGLVYLIFHFCYAKQIDKQLQKPTRQQQPDTIQNHGRQPLM